MALTYRRLCKGHVKSETSAETMLIARTCWQFPVSKSMLVRYCRGPRVIYVIFNHLWRGVARWELATETFIKEWVFGCHRSVFLAFSCFFHFLLGRLAYRPGPLLWRSSYFNFVIVEAFDLWGRASVPFLPYSLQSRSVLQCILFSIKFLGRSALHGNQNASWPLAHDASLTLHHFSPIFCFFHCVIVKRTHNRLKKGDNVVRYNPCLHNISIEKLRKRRHFILQLLWVKKRLFTQEGRCVSITKIHLYEDKIEFVVIDHV